MYLAYYSSPEDFVVTEINSKSELVILDTFDAPPPISTLATSADTAESAVSRKMARPDAAAVPPLQELVTPERYHSLQELALTYKTTLGHDPDQLVDLGKWVW